MVTMDASPEGTAVNALICRFGSVSFARVVGEDTKRLQEDKNIITTMAKIGLYFILLIQIPPIFNIYSPVINIQSQWIVNINNQRFDIVEKHSVWKIVQLY